MNRLLVCTAVLVMAACSGDEPPLVATDVRITQSMPGSRMAAGYLALTNNTTQTITITHVSSPQYDSVEMHESVVEDGVARMYPLAGVTLLPGRTVRFEPGGKHLMLIRASGAVDGVTLDFYAGKAVVLSVHAPAPE